MVYGAALRPALNAGEPIRRADIVKPGDRDFLQVVLTPGARAIAIPVHLMGPTDRAPFLLFPGDRVDVILTQNFKQERHSPAARSARRWSRISACWRSTRWTQRQTPTPARDRDPRGDARAGREDQGRHRARQARLTLRSVSGPGRRHRHLDTRVHQATGVKPTWAGDVSPALGGAMPEKRSRSSSRRSRWFAAPTGKR